MREEGGKMKTRVVQIKIPVGNTIYHACAHCGEIKKDDDYYSPVLWHLHWIEPRPIATNPNGIIEMARFKSKKDAQRWVKKSAK